MDTMIPIYLRVWEAGSYVYVNVRGVDVASWGDRRGLKGSWFLYDTPGT